MDHSLGGLLTSATSSDSSIGAQAVISPEPAVNVYSSLFAGEANGAAYLSYFGQLNGPAGAPIPVDLTGTISVASSRDGINNNEIVVSVAGVNLDATSLCGNALQLEVFTTANVKVSCFLI